MEKLSIDKILFLTWIVICCFSFYPQKSFAVSLEENEKGLKMIADFADRLCNKIPLQGHGDSLELTGSAKAELNGIIKKLVKLGIDGAIKYQDSEYEGLLQKDLVSALKHSTDCRLQIWNDLKDKLTSSITSTPPLPENSTHTTSESRTDSGTPNSKQSVVKNTGPLFMKDRDDVLIHENVVRLISDYDPSQPVYIGFGDGLSCGNRLTGNGWMFSQGIKVDRYRLIKEGGYWRAQGMVNIQFNILQLKDNKSGAENARWAQIQNLQDKTHTYFGVDCHGNPDRRAIIVE